MTISNQNLSAQQLYDRFMEVYELSNRRPTPTKDVFLTYSLRLVVIGSVLLSGSRTAAAVAATHTLENFSNLIGVPEKYAAWANGLEGLFAFLTIEAALVVGGYMLGENKEPDKRWFYAFLGAAVAPALMSNLAPALKLLPNAETGVTLIVNVFVGLATLTMAVIGGRVLAIHNTIMSKKYLGEIEEWEEAAKRAWYRSAQYKLAREFRVEKPVQNEDPGDHQEEILTYLKTNGDTNLTDLASALNLPLKQVTNTFRYLNSKGEVEVEGTIAKLSNGRIDKK